jgi:hypothetical protein
MSTRAVIIAGWLVLVLVTLPAEAQASQSGETPLQNPALKPLYAELRALFLKHYPKVTSHLLGDKIHFEHDTRVFIVHEPQKTGEWQDPWETRGPKPGGILCDMTLHKGPYQGAAAVPQSFDKRYFTTLLLAPYSRERDVHLQVHLSYPRNVNAEFLKEFTKLLDEFRKPVN